MSDRNESPFEIVSKEEVESSQQKDQERKGGGPVQVRRQNVDVVLYFQNSLKISNSYCVYFCFMYAKKII